LDNSSDQQVVPGIVLTPAGEALVSRSVAEVLFDLAIRLEESSLHPVDVEHVLAAVVLAARRGEVSPDTTLSADDPALIKALEHHVDHVFEQFGGRVGEDD
jgi:hypothetical protein